MANPKGNPQNLKPFPKGVSGNPKGPTPVLPEIKALMAKILGNEYNGLTEAEHILLAIGKVAKAGDVRAAEFLFDRGFGKVTSNLDIKSDGERLQAPILNIVPPTNH